MTPLFDHLNRGSDILHQNSRRTSRSVLRSIIPSLALAIIIIAFFLHHFEPDTYDILRLWFQAWWKSWAGAPLLLLGKSPDWHQVIAANGQVWEPTQLEPCLWPNVIEFFSHYWKGAAVLWAACNGLILLLTHFYGQWRTRLKLHRGLEIVSQSELRRRIPWRERSPYTIAHVPYLRNSEFQNTIIIGTPGTGKSLTILDLIDQIRSRGDRAIIYDPTLSFFSFSYRPGDGFPNPQDARGQNWNPFLDIDGPADSKAFAKALIPEGREPYWTDAPRSVLSVFLDKCPERTTESLLNFLYSVDLPDLIDLTRGTPAERHLKSDDPRTISNLLSTVVTYAHDLGNLRPGPGDFSLHRFLEEDSNSFLFLGAKGRDIDAILPLMRVMLEICANSFLSLPSSHRRRKTFLIIDELPTLGKLEAVPKLLSQGRKYGVCSVLGLQNYSQLVRVYGPAGASEMAGLCSTFLTFRLGDPDSATWASKNLTELDINLPQESLNYGASDMRDGRHLAESRRTQPAVSPTEIMQLNDLEGFIRVRGRYPVASVRIPLVKRDPLIPEFVPLPDDQTVAWKLSNQP